MDEEVYNIFMLVVSFIIMACMLYAVFEGV